MLKLLATLLCVALPLTAEAQRPQPTSPPPPQSAPTPEEKPLPDIPTLMRQVESNERLSEAIQKNYTYHESAILDELNSHDGIKKSEHRDFDISWINGVRIARLVAIDGKPLTPEKQKKEDAEIDKQVAKAKEKREKADAQNKETDSHGNQEITLARILELGAFSNPRRQLVANRPTILVDYTGDPKAKTHNAAEGAFKQLTGTICIDEQDKTLQHLEGHFMNDFKLMGGLAVDVRKGTSFQGTFIKVNDEVWLPQSFAADGHARYLLFFSLTGRAQIHDSNYRKFRTSSTILPNITKIPPDPTTPPTP